MIDYSERNNEIYNRHNNGETYRKLASEYGLTTARVREIFMQRKRKFESRERVLQQEKEMLQNNDHAYSFLNALEDARIELGMDRSLEVRTYNCLYRAGILPVRLDGKGDGYLNDWSDKKLLDNIYGMGTKCLQLARRAYDFWVDKNDITFCSN